MERHTDELREKLERLLQEAAAVSVELDQVEGRVEGVPHYSVIESRAHELGQQLSRTIQERHLHEMIRHQARRATCPGCGASCEVRVVERGVTSIDGDLNLSELRGECPTCRRAFFPLARTAGF